MHKYRAQNGSERPERAETHGLNTDLTRGGHADKKNLEMDASITVVVQVFNLSGQVENLYYNATLNDAPVLSRLIRQFPLSGQPSRGYCISRTALEGVPLSGHP